MAYKELQTRIKWCRDTSANWTSNNPVLLDGEIIIVDTDSGETRFKIGDGVKTYTQLPFEDEAVRNLINNKVDKVDGKGLSTNDYTTEEKNKLANAEVVTNKITTISADSDDEHYPTAKAVYNFVDVATDDELIDMLVETDAIIAVSDSDGALLADENGNILLW